MHRWFTRTTLTAAAAAAAPLLLAAVLSGWVLDEQLARARDHADSAVRADVATSVSVVRTAIRNQQSAAADPQPGDRVVRASDPAGVSAAAVAAARDTGTSTLDDTGRTPVFVVPVFRTGAPHMTSAQRRAAVVAYRLVPLTLGNTLDDLVPATGGLLVRGPDRVVVTEPQAAPAGARTYAVDMDLSDAPGWAVAGWRPDPPVPTGAWFGVAALLALGIGAGVALGALVRRHARLAARLAVLEHDRALLNELTPILQSSLDVGEVVPAVATHLMDGWGLDGLSVSTPTDAGERDLFACGTVPDRGVPPAVGAPAGLAPGATSAVALTRGGRVLGVLRVRAGRPLDADELATLRAVGEALGSALANTAAFARQEELLERMHTVDEAKTVFLATASHELRTPVTAIVGFSRLLLTAGRMTEEQRTGLLERVAANGQRLDKLIEQLLDYSRIERGRIAPGTDVLDVATHVQRILQEQGAELAATHTVRVDTLDAGRVRGSESALERIVTNLVGNAGKYSPAGTSITVRVAVGDGKVVLTVDDEGPGVPEGDRERVFSRFYRGHGDAERRTRGAGMGLAIVADYAASMAGTAWVTAAPGGGARFVVAFPLFVEADPSIADQVGGAARGPLVPSS